MNKQFNAVALANKALRKENTMLWEKVDVLERGAEEMRLLYETIIKQLVMTGPLANDDPINPLYSATLPKVDKKELDRFVLAARTTDDGMILKVYETPEEYKHAERED